MTVTISLLGIIVLLMVFNTILEHLFSWAFRVVTREEVEDVVLGILFGYIIKWVILYYILKVLLE